MVVISIFLEFSVRKIIKKLIIKGLFSIFLEFSVRKIIIFYKIINNKIITHHNPA